MNGLMWLTVRRASNEAKTPRWLIWSEWHLFLNEANCVTRVVQGLLLLGDTRCVLIIITFFPQKSKCKSQPFLQITIRLQCIGGNLHCKAARLHIFLAVWKNSHTSCLGYFCETQKTEFLMFHQTKLPNVNRKKMSAV